MVVTKEELKSVKVGSGALSVVARGVTERLKLFVDNWDTAEIVSENKLFFNEENISILTTPVMTF